MKCRDPGLKLLLPLWRSRSAKVALDNDPSRLLLIVSFSQIYFVELFLEQWFIILVVSTRVETDGQPKRRRAVLTRRLVTLAGRFYGMCLKLSTVGVEVGSFRSRLLMMVIVMLK